MNIWHWIVWLLYRVQETNWRAFFATNGPGELIDKRFRSFKEHHDEYKASCQWTAQITGKNREHRGPAIFYASATVEGRELAIADGDWKRSQYLRNKVAESESRLESFARADCRCRLGFHWKCAVHHNWVG